ncbi:MAG TPA: class I SAM-dependent methyltransferase [Streptosporangiaceae bacterium]|jgi:predicted O-methyltransferase YrrM|nr:class I SAM-dependent methyltransferase [Streptosporangiaceae bacterium]
MDELPDLVEQACVLARRLGFPLTREEAERIGPGVPSACLPGVGRFLAVMAAGCRGGRIGEIGTGVGIGAAWMAGAMPADCSLVTVEIDEDRAAAARDLFAGDARVSVLTGDARAVLGPYAPFGLLFADGGWRDPGGLASLVELVRVGGRLVMDDVTPATPVRPDVKRELFFGDSRLLSVEVVLPDLRNSLLLGTRLS